MEWTRRLNRLHAAVSRRTGARDFNGAHKALRILRSGYDYWARECFREPARQAQAQSDAGLCFSNNRALANAFRL
jgi:hypothetical protein